MAPRSSPNASAERAEGEIRPRLKKIPGSLLSDKPSVNSLRPGHRRDFTTLWRSAVTQLAERGHTDTQPKQQNGLLRYGAPGLAALQPDPRPAHRQPPTYPN